GRNVDRLEGGDGALLSGRNALLEITHFGGQRRLITDGARSAAQQSGHFRPRLGEAEDVVDKQEHVLISLVAEVFRDRQTGQADAKARARWFVHLAVNQRDLGFAEVFLVDNAGLGHFGVKVVSLTSALTHTSEDRDTAVELGDVINQLHDDDGLAHAGPTKRTHLATL